MGLEDITLTLFAACNFIRVFAYIPQIHKAATDVNGASAEAHLTGAYDYVSSDGKNQRQPLAIQASFRRDGGAWKLMSVRSSDR